MIELYQRVSYHFRVCRSGRYEKGAAHPFSYRSPPIFVLTAIMAVTVRDLIVILDTYLPAHFTIDQALRILVTVAALYPLLHLHTNQRREPRQPRETAWKKRILPVIRRSLYGDPGSDSDEDIEMEDEETEECAKGLYRDITEVFEYLGFDSHDNHPGTVIPTARPILCTPRKECIICPPNQPHRALHAVYMDNHREEQSQSVRLLDENLDWRTADLFIAECTRCRARYYPDRITFLREATEDESDAGSDGDERMQKLETDSVYLRVSRHGIWVHRRVAKMQEYSVHRFRAGWSTFADWLGDITDKKLTNRQAKCLFIEHFSRRLLTAHQMGDNFTCVAHAKTDVLAEAVRIAIGKDGGILPGALHHGCQDCTHQKRYREDLLDDGATFEEAETAIADVPLENAVSSSGILMTHWHLLKHL